MKLTTSVDFEFSNREELDEYVSLITSRLSGYIPRQFLPALDQIAETLNAKRLEVDSKDDLELIPELLRLLNFHLDNIYTHNRDMFEKMGVSGKVATKLYFDQDLNKWVSDNGFQMYSTIAWSLKWFELSAPKYWKMPDGTKWHP